MLEVNQERKLQGASVRHLIAVVVPDGFVNSNTGATNVVDLTVAVFVVRSQKNGERGVRPLKSNPNN